MATEAATNGNGAENGASKFSAMKPQLFVEALKAGDAVQFYKAAFGAEEINRVTHPKRKAEQELPLLLSAEIKIGPSSLLVSDLSDESAPVKVAGTGLVFCLETEDVKGAVAKAVKAGAVSEGEITEGEGEGEGACCGGRVGKLKDPYGIHWLICSPAGKVTADVEA